MARFTRLEVLGAMLEERLVPVFYHPDPKTLPRRRARLCARADPGCSSSRTAATAPTAFSRTSSTS
jgi:hypothetical protein